MRLSSSRLAWLYVLLVGVSVSLLIGLRYWYTTRAIEEESSAVIRAETEDLLDVFRLGGLPQLRATLRQRADSWGRTGAVYLLADAERNPLAGNLQTWPEDVRAERSRQEFQVTATVNGLQGVHPVEAQVEALARGRYWLIIGTDVSDQRRLQHRFAVGGTWGVVLTTGLTALLGFWYSRRINRRVRESAIACENIMQGDLSLRLPADGTADDFDALGNAVNRMLDRLEHQALTLQTTFRSAAHDLRAPLYRLRIRLEEALLNEPVSIATRALVQPAIDEVDRMHRTLGLLLQIAQAESSGRLAHTERVDLATLAAEMAELYAPQAAEQQLQLSAHTDSPAWVYGNRQLLAQLIINLLENGLKYVPAGGRIEVGVHVSAPGAQVVLTVADNGPGIPAEDRERSLRPFERLHSEPANAAAGSGLGLSLVASVAHLHGAALSIDDNSPGLRATVRFNPAPPP